MLIIVTLNPKFRAMQNRIYDADRAATAGIPEARVGARSFAARNECLEEVEDDCDDKEYERHGVPSEAGVFPVFDVMSARLMSQKRPATSQK